MSRCAEVWLSRFKLVVTDVPGVSKVYRNIASSHNVCTRCVPGTLDVFKKTFQDVTGVFQLWSRDLEKSPGVLQVWSRDLEETPGVFQVFRGFSKVICLNLS